MKIVTLNVWGGKLYEPFINFIKEKSEEVEIFCFQDALFGTRKDSLLFKKGELIFIVR